MLGEPGRAQLPRTANCDLALALEIFEKTYFFYILPEKRNIYRKNVKFTGKNVNFTTKKRIFFYRKKP